MASKYITSVEITDLHIKVIEALGSEASATLTHCEVREIVQFTDQEISKTLEEIFSSKKIHTENIVLGVSRRFVMLRHLSLPSHIDAEIKKMVDLQAIRQMPYAREDVVLDYFVIDKEPSGYARVLAVIVHKDVLQRYLKIFTDAHLTLHKLTLSSSGLLGWYVYQTTKTKVKMAAAVAMINVDSVVSEFCFFYNQKLLFSRNLNFGAKDLTDEGIGGFLEEIQVTISAYQKENPGKDISRMLVSSSLSQAVLLKNKIEAELSISTDVVDPLSTIGKSKDLQLPISLYQKGVSLMLGVGLCLSKQDKLINLLPAEVSLSRETQYLKQEWVKLVVLVGIAGGLLVTGFGLQIYQKRSQLKTLEQKFTESRSKVDAIKRKMEQLDVIQKQFNDRVLMVDVIQELYRLTPRDITYTVIELGEENSLTLQGVASAGVGINVFQKSLVDSLFFENVNLQYATKRKVPEGEITDFKIVCRMTKP